MAAGLTRAGRAQQAGSASMSIADRNALQAALDAYDQGQAARAEPVLRDLATRYPKNYEANEALGGIYAESNDLVRALPYLQQACAIAPQQALAHANLGAAYAIDLDGRDRGVFGWDIGSVVSNPGSRASGAFSGRGAAIIQ